MTEDRDPYIQSLFAEAQQNLDGEAFTAAVMAQTTNFRYRVITGFVCVALAMAACAWYFAIPLEVAQLTAQILTTTLIDLGDTWLAWALSPINNIASLLALSVKVLRSGRKKILAASYTS